jgi:polysaccharide biosynthesis protein PslG
MSERWLARALRGEVLWIWLALHVLVIAGLLLSMVAAWFAQDYFTRGVAAGPDLDPIPYTNVNPMGVNTFLNEEPDPEVVERSLDMIADGGFGYIRQIFGWYEIEPEPGVFINSFGGSTWEKYDRIVDLANERGIEIIARLEKPPRWSREGQPHVDRFPDGPPNEIADWVNYIEIVVQRYQGRITYFQLWNEPNLEGEWGGLPIDAAGYVELLQAGYEAAKRVNPDAVILLASFAPTDQLGPVNVSDLLYLQEVYDHGGADYFDIATVMVYGYGFSPHDRRVSFERNNFSRPIQTREIMERNDDAHKPIWAVEYGWVSLPDDWDGEASPWGRPVSAEQQAEYLVEGYLRAQREWPWMGVMAVWAFRWVRPDDHEDERRNPTRGFGLVEHDFTPRPAYLALQEAAPRIQLLHTGAYDLSDAQREASATGQRLDFAFSGERLDVVLVTGSGGVLDITLNGEPQPPVSLIPGDAGRITAVSGLADRPHQLSLQLQSEPTAAPPEIRQIIVSRQPVHSWIYPWIFAAIGLTLLAVSGSLLLGLWRRRAPATRR